MPFDGRQKITQSGILRISIVIAIVIFLQIIYIVFEGKYAGLGFPIDDPWIHMQFAKNVAEGYGFSYNAKEPVAGSTAPLWTILLVPIHWITKNITLRILMVKILGVLLFIITLIFIYFLSFRITSNNNAAFFSALAAGTTTHLNWGAVSGLEIPLYVLLTIVVIYLNYEMCLQRKTKLMYLIPVLIGLAVYARPECALLLIFYFLDNIPRWITKRRLSFLIIATCLFVATLLPYFIFNYSLSGSIFPNTFRAKAQQNSIFVALSTMNLLHLKWLFLKMAPAYFGQSIAHLFKANPLFVYGLFMGAFIIIYRKFKSPNDQSLSLMPVLVAFFYAPLIGLISPFISADFHGGRYIANQVAIGALIAVWGFYWLFQTIKRLSKTAIKIIIFVIVAIALYNTIFAQVFMIKFSASNVKSINEIQVKTGKWIKENIPPDAIVAVNDIGAIKYFSDRRIIDLCGLVEPKIIAYFKKYGDNKLGAYVYVMENKPDYLAIFPRWYPQLTDTNRFQVLYKIIYNKNTASEWVFIPEVETYMGIVLKSLTVKPIPSEKWILKTKF